MATERILDNDTALIEAHKFFDKKANYYKAKFEASEKGSVAELKAFVVFNEFNEIRNNLWLLTIYGKGNIKVSIDRKHIWTAYTLFANMTEKSRQAYNKNPYGLKGERAFLKLLNNETIENALWSAHDSLRNK